MYRPWSPRRARIEYTAHIHFLLSEAHGIPFAVKKRGGLSDANHIAACGPIFLDGLGPTGDLTTVHGNIWSCLPSSPTYVSRGCCCGIWPIKRRIYDH